MEKSRSTKVSKYLSLHLRHQPDRLGLTLAAGGWVEVDLLLQRCGESGFAISRSELDEVVALSDKKRFSFDDTGNLIRANQGHSVDVDLQLVPAEPPERLYHGTGASALPLIMQDGLRKMNRHHVHLSADIETAKKVGARHGKPVVLVLGISAMIKAGYQFYVSANGVWLVDAVPVKFLSVL